MQVNSAEVDLLTPALKPYRLALENPEAPHARDLHVTQRALPWRYDEGAARTWLHLELADEPPIVLDQPEGARGFRGDSVTTPLTVTERSAVG
jgi:hypothetical protein